MDGWMGWDGWDAWYGWDGWDGNYGWNWNLTKLVFEDRIKLKFIVKKSFVSRSRTNNNGVNSRIRTNSRTGWGKSSVINI